ncbi:MAG: prepilin-type N-terminal cleavage/methylation domain-containing protein [Proteobacteria bacterium]|nr:prepilin-type N-terminal cleavage/methylation domain-containing protein [Pseudomonadota bacterium]
MPANIFTNKTLSSNQGFTLIEIVITIVILGAVAGILVPFFNAIVHSPDPVIRERAISLGQAMMDEIIAKKWDENSPNGGGPLNTSESARGTVAATPVATLGVDAGENRTTYDDVDDYRSMPAEVDNFTDQNGSNFSLPGYRRQVAVDYIASPSAVITQNLPTISATATDTKRVVVTITSPLGEVFNFVAVACNI